jgi:hypothetical protein
MCGLDTSGSEQGPVAGSCERGNEPLAFVRGEDYSPVEFSFPSGGAERVQICLCGTSHCVYSPNRVRREDSQVGCNAIRWVTVSFSRTLFRGVGKIRPWNLQPWAQRHANGHVVTVTIFLSGDPHVSTWRRHGNSVGREKSEAVEKCSQRFGAGSYPGPANFRACVYIKYPLIRIQVRIFRVTTRN